MDRLSTVLCMALGASFVVDTDAVTAATSTPTSDSNYMVLQGEWSYLNARGVDHGAVAGNVQLVRSALTANSAFSFNIQFADAADAPVDGTTLTAVIARHICSVVNTAGSATPYQDPYNCDGYELATNTNACNAGTIASNPDFEATVTCTVTTTSSGSLECAGSLDWPVYIPEFFDDQNLEDLSFVLSSGSGEFVCANLDEARELTATDSGSSGFLTSGSIEKDELGYTILDLSVEGLAAGTTYTASVSSSPCDTADSTFGGFNAVTGLAAPFTTDASGDASGVSAFIASIADSSTMAIVLIDSDDAEVACFDLQLFDGPDGRSGDVPVGQPGSGVGSGGSGAGRNTGDDSGVSSDACAVWAPFYSSSEVDAFGSKSGMGMGMGMGKKGKKGRYGGASSFSNFESTVIGAESRCCLNSAYAASSSKSKSSSLLMGMTSKQLASQSGAYAGIAGGCVLFIALAMHIRRRTMASSASDDVITERTPLTSQ